MRLKITVCQKSRNYYSDDVNLDGKKGVAVRCAEERKLGAEDYNNKD